MASGFGGGSNGGAKKEEEGEWVWLGSCEREGVSWVNGDGD